ncbi:MAG: UDP-N-acetylmuramoyl-L-alanyl-D-glutamate--2,6-diaminopimelate ligase [Planctomycetota bacterium]
MQPTPIAIGELIARAIGEAALPSSSADIRVCDLCADSRKVTPGSLFVAVPGTRVRGATFANEAAARGAVAVVTDTDVEVKEGPVVIRVPDARVALARLAAVFFGLDRIQAAGELRATGVTGTNGKSTVAHMLRSILRAADQPVAMLGTIEYDLFARTMQAALTTPDAITLARLFAEAHAAGARHVVMEVSSHSLDQRRTDGIRFSTALFTNLTQDHLDYHENLDDYLLAKKRLFDGLESDALAVVNADEPASPKIVEHCKARIIRYAVETDGDMRARIIEEGKPGTRFSLEHETESFEIHTPMVGRHNAVNALAAASAALAAGIAPGPIREGLASLGFVPGRLQSVDTGDLGFNVFVDYAHTDDALKNVLRAARPLTRGKLWCVFGCGGDRDRTKRPRMAQAVAQGADRLVITSDNPRTEDPLAIIADIEQGLSREDRERAAIEPDRTCAIGYAVSRLEPGDTLIIAGKGHEDYQILGTEKMHFDDVETALSAIRRR